MNADEAYDEFFDYYEAGIMLCCRWPGCTWEAPADWDALATDGSARRTFIEHVKSAHIGSQ